jgi:formylglycine-generating enzyme
MRDLVFFAGMASSVILGCGGSAESSNSNLSTGGTGGIAASSGGASAQSGRSNGGGSSTTLPAGGREIGGTSNGGAAIGGAATGGKAAGGATIGGAAMGGKAAGGAALGGAATGGTGTAGGRAGASSGGAKAGAGGSWTGVAGAGGSRAGSSGNAGTPSGGGEAGSSCRCQALEQCWNGTLCVANLVPVPAGFSIDATEVTRGQYAAWLATNPSTIGQGGACASNTSFAPDSTCMAKSSVCQGTDCGQHPQPCVDLCDAAAYCKTIDKRLCGAIGGGSVSAYSDATNSQWYNACTSNGVNRYVFGNSSGQGNCHDAMDFDSNTTTVPVASMPECQSPVTGYTGIYDLLGNLWEWEDNCSLVPPATAESCKPRGTSFGISAMMPECGTIISVQRSTVGDNIGFRCCSP